MDRRTFLKTAAGSVAAAGGLATPAISQRAAARTLRFVPQADLANFDPIWNTQFVVRNGAALVWDMLYGVDDKLQPRRQMVEAEEVSADGLTWTFRLRPGLKFHDGEPVLAKDVVASLNRWAARDQLGLMIRAVQNELAAVDDRTLPLGAEEAIPRMLLALGKNATPCCFIMPERIAATDPFKQINDHVGSGPMRFVDSEWVPGGKAVFEKFPGYVPRQEPASWLAGGKQMLVDRIEWVVMPDPATASAALAERRGRLVGVSRSPIWCRAAQEPQPDGGHCRSARQRRLLPPEPPASAFQRCAGAASDPDGCEPGRLHARHRR